MLPNHSFNEESVILPMRGDVAVDNDLINIEKKVDHILGT